MLLLLLFLVQKQALPAGMAFEIPFFLYLVGTRCCVYLNLTLSIYITYLFISSLQTELGLGSLFRSAKAGRTT